MENRTTAKGITQVFRLKNLTKKLKGKIQNRELKTFSKFVKSIQNYHKQLNIVAYNRITKKKYFLFYHIQLSEYWGLKMTQKLITGKTP